MSLVLRICSLPPFFPLTLRPGTQPLRLTLDDKEARHAAGLLLLGESVLDGASVAVISVFRRGAAYVQPSVEGGAVARVIEDGRRAHRPRRDVHVLPHKGRDDAGEDGRRPADHVLVVDLGVERLPRHAQHADEARGDGAVFVARAAPEDTRVNARVIRVRRREVQSPVGGKQLENA